MNLLTKTMPVFALLLSSTISMAAPNGGRGGGDLRQLDAADVKLLVGGNDLKNAMLNYLNTLSVSKISDAGVKDSFGRAMAGDALKKDILTPGNYSVEDSCKDAYDADVPASTKIGDVGGKICFDAKKIADQLQNLSKEEVTIRLASLAFHEHMHHFQNPANELNKNEAEAYQLAAYVQITAKIVQVPLLKWADPNAVVPTSGIMTFKCTISEVDNDYPASNDTNAQVTFDSAKTSPELKVGSAYGSKITASAGEALLPDGSTRMEVNSICADNICSMGSDLILYPKSKNAYEFARAQVSCTLTQ